MEVTAFTDGGSRGNPGPSAIGVVIKWPDKMDSLRGEYIGIKTNNEAEWAALIWLLHYLKYASVTKATVYCDSQLIVNQFNGKWAASDRMGAFLRTAKELEAAFESVVVSWVPREQNAEADKLVNEALDAEQKDRSATPEVPKASVPNCL